MRAAVPEATTGSVAAQTIELAAETRADQYLTALRAYPWVSVSLIVIGIALTIYGLVAWKARQAKLDADEDEAYRQRRALGQTTEATAAEKEAKLESETDSADDAPSEATGAEDRTARGAASQTVPSANEQEEAAARQARMSHLRSQQRERLERSETQIGHLLSSSFASTHNVEAGVRVDYPEVPGRTSILDFVARAKEPGKWTSFAVEVRATTARGLVAISDSFRRNMVSVALAARGVPEGPLPNGNRGRPALAKSVSLLVVVISEPSESEGRSSLERRMVASIGSQVLHRTSEMNSILGRKVGVIVIHERTLRKLRQDHFGEMVQSVLRDPSRPYVDNEAFESP